MKTLGPLLVTVIIVMTACGSSAPAVAPPTVAAAATASAATASPPPIVKVKVAWTAASGTQGGIWAAYEGGYFKEEGLDVELVSITASSTSITALVANDLQFSGTDLTGLVEADVRGASIKGIIALTNRLIFSFMVSPKIKRGEDLKGKTIGITRLGSSTQTAALQVLQRYGVDPREVTFIQLQDVPAILAALQGGQVDAAALSPPTNTRAKAAGFTELMNLATEGPAYPNIVMSTTAQYIAEHPDVVKRFVRAYGKGLQRFKTDKDFGIKAMNVYLKLTDTSVLEDTWLQFSKYLAGKTPLVEGMEIIIAEVAQREPKAVGAKPAQFLDESFVRDLTREGFYNTFLP